MSRLSFGKLRCEKRPSIAYNYCNDGLTKVTDEKVTRV